jgi:peptidoglycan/LPS O-acetylase OafA/YrhL
VRRVKEALTDKERTMTATAPTSTDTIVRPSSRPIWKTGAIAALAAAVVNMAIAAAAGAADVSLAIEGEEIPVAGFATMTILWTFVGIVLAVVLNRRARRPQRTFVVSTVVLTVLSLLSPLTGDTETATRVVLELTHLAAAAIVIPAIAGKLRRDPVR